MSQLAVISAVIFLICIAISQCSPVTPADSAKLTCKHSKSIKNADWKKCIKATGGYTYNDVHTHFKDAVFRMEVDDHYLNVLPNNFQCYSVHMYNQRSVCVAECPAVCKLKDSDEKDDKACDQETLLTSVSSPVGHAVKIASPRYDCGLQYRPQEVCLYNVSLPCKTSHVTVSSDLSSIHLAHGDFLDIVDYSLKSSYPEITGSSSLELDLHIYSRDFVILFWSSDGEKKSGSGFGMHMECDESEVNIEEKEKGDGGDEQDDKQGQEKNKKEDQEDAIKQDKEQHNKQDKEKVDKQDKEQENKQDEQEGKKQEKQYHEQEEEQENEQDEEQYYEQENEEDNEQEEEQDREDNREQNKQTNGRPGEQVVEEQNDDEKEELGEQNDGRGNEQDVEEQADDDQENEDDGGQTNREDSRGGEQHGGRIDEQDSNEESSEYDEDDAIIYQTEEQDQGRDDEAEYDDTRG